MVLFGSVLCMYLVSIFQFSWGAWSVLICFMSLPMILIDFSGWSNYYLLSEWFGLDQFSVVMIVLCYLVLAVSLVSSCKDLQFMKEYYKKGASMAELVILISLGSIMFFSLCSWMDFYFFFEFSLVPTFWLILSWGYQPERLQAGLYMIMYTVSASLPLLIGLLMFYFNIKTDNMFLVKCLGGKVLFKLSGWLWFFISMGFLVKLPIFFFHGWLPKAHVEAPLSGSMLLAGVLLKFGAYGVIRMLWMTEICMTNQILVVTCITIWGGFMSSCVACCQSDLKALIAYSSIGHMAICLGGALSLYSLGKVSSVCFLFAHGLTSPMLFAMAASMYDLVKTRNVVLSKGILRLFPLFSMYWFLFSIFNMGFPPSLNFLGETFCVVSLGYYCLIFLIPAGLMVFLTACYSLILYSWCNHGSWGSVGLPINGVSMRYHYGPFCFMVLLLGGFLGLDFFFG